MAVVIHRLLFQELLLWLVILTGINSDWRKSQLDNISMLSIIHRDWWNLYDMSQTQFSNSWRDWQGQTNISSISSIWKNISAQSGFFCFVLFFGLCMVLIWLQTRCGALIVVWFNVIFLHDTGSLPLLTKFLSVCFLLHWPGRWVMW